MNDRLKLLEFAIESNSIEGISDGSEHYIHFCALQWFLKEDSIEIENIARFVSAVQPDSHLRTEPNHRVLIGGREGMNPSMVVTSLDALIERIHRDTISPYRAHAEYEMIHPFMDGNGRSGRALWLWQMVNRRNYDGSLVFLHKHYYQSLEYYSEHPRIAR